MVREYIRLFGSTYLTRAISVLLSMGITMLVARGLGPEGRGVFAVVGTYSLLAVQFATFGFASFNTFASAKHMKLVQRIISNSQFLSTAYALVSLTVAFLLFKFSDVEGPIVLGILLVPLLTSSNLLLAVFMGLYRVAVVNIHEIFTKLLAFLIILGLFLQGSESVTYYFGAQVAVAGFGLLFIFYKLGQLELGLKPIFYKKIAGISLKFGTPVFLSSIFMTSLLKFDFILLEELIGSESVGFYSISVAVGDIFLLIPIVFGTLYFPKLSQMSKLGQMKSLKTSIGVLFVIQVGLALFAFFLSPILIPLLFGSQYLASILPFQYLLPGLVFLSLNMVFQNFFAARGELKVIIWIPLVAFILNIALNFLLIGRLEAQGAAIASSISYAVMTLISLAYIVRLSRMANISSLDGGSDFK